MSSYMEKVDFYHHLSTVFLLNMLKGHSKVALKIV